MSRTGTNDERDRDGADDPTTYVYWREHGFRGRPPSRRGPHWGWLALSLALLCFLAAVMILAASRHLP